MRSICNPLWCALNHLVQQLCHWLAGGTFIDLQIMTSVASLALLESFHCWPCWLCQSQDLPLLPYKGLMSCAFKAQHQVSMLFHIQDLSMHKEEIHSKLVAIMRERLATNLKQLPLIASSWTGSSPPKPSQIPPSNFAQTNAKQLRILSQASSCCPLLFGHVEVRLALTMCFAGGWHMYMRQHKLGDTAVLNCLLTCDFCSSGHSFRQLIADMQMLYTGPLVLQHMPMYCSCQPHILSWMTHAAVKLKCCSV